MKISVQWLREWVNPPQDNGQIAGQLTGAGLEIEGQTPVAGDFSGVVVARVADVAPHPSADRLRICQVDVGAPELLTIVCGAANVAVAMRVPCALLGARLPDGTRLKRAKLRGVESAGMLCSAAELGLAATSEGLLELPVTAPIGADLRDFLRLDDQIFEVNITPNRGDCLSVAGLARELGVLNRLPVQGPGREPVSAASAKVFPVTIHAPESCPRYVGRVMHGLDRASTPIWMQERLRRSGMRSLGLMVDVTNYVLLELGQPLHAFDLRQLSDAIVVRYAHSGEKLTLLDGTALTLDADSLVIADRQKILALAGIMGGAASGIAADTTDLFLESAFFTPEAIQGRARRYGLQTESSYRFERGVDPHLQRDAIERATQLLLEIAGGVPGPIIEICAPEYLPRPAEISLHSAWIQRLLGIEIPHETVSDILTRLGMDILPTSEGWVVTPPAFRFDLKIAADLIEELARIHGYQNIPQSRPTLTPALGAVPENPRDPRRTRDFFTARAYHEVITYSFIDPALQALLDPETPPLRLANPLAAEMAVMRTNLWPGLINVARYNLYRQQPRVRIFELGRTFVHTATGLRQNLHLAGLAFGNAAPEQWGQASRPVTFFDIKADLEAFLGPALTFTPQIHPALHPGQTAEIKFSGKNIGWIGALHPQLNAQLAIGNLPVLLFDIELELPSGAPPHFQTISKFPAVRRDLALIVRQEILAADLLKSIRHAAGNLLHELTLFDVYTGSGIEPGDKSIALGLILQDTEKTLTEAEVETVINSVLRQLHSQFGAIRRDK